MIEKPKIHPFQHYDLHLIQAEKDNLLGHHYTVANIAAQVADMTDTVITEAIIHEAADAGITDLYLIDKTFIREAIQEKMDRENPKPLTIEELRQINGEPLWLTGIEWRVCYGTSTFRGSEYLETGMGSGIPLDGYGESWYAYRHKPKEAAE